MTQPVLSIIMPAYNEQEAIGDAISDIKTHILPHIKETEIIVVNDGSKDDTGKILDQLAAEMPELKPLHKENGGHGPALLHGLDHAKGEWILLLDSDRQIELNDFGTHWQQAQTVDGVFGIRKKRHDPLHRLVLTRCIAFALFTLFGAKLSDANIPYKLFRRTLWKKARSIIADGTLAPSLFFAAFCAVYKFNILYIPVTHLPRTTGTVNLKPLKLFRFCKKAFGQLWNYRNILFSQSPDEVRAISKENVKS